MVYQYGLAHGKSFGALFGFLPSAKFDQATIEGERRQAEAALRRMAKAWREADCELQAMKSRLAAMEQAPVVFSVARHKIEILQGLERKEGDLKRDWEDGFRLANEMYEVGWSKTIEDYAS